MEYKNINKCVCLQESFHGNINFQGDTSEIKMIHLLIFQGNILQDLFHVC